MKIGVFCSANSNIDPAFFAAAEELGSWMGRNGHTLVFGGCDMGLMQCVASAVKRAGGRTVGVIPSLVEQNGHASRDVDVEFPCDNLSDRKDLMLVQSDVMVALPGGIGTLDEVFTVAASATIGYHRKRVVLYNVNDFWQPLIHLLDDLEQRGMVRGNYNRVIGVAHTFDQLVEMITTPQ